MLQTSGAQIGALGVAVGLAWLGHVQPAQALPLGVSPPELRMNGPLGTVYAQGDPYGGGAYQEPPPPQANPEEGFEVPGFSVRVDPFNWLLEGRLGFELEVEVYDFITAELVPIFVVSEQPPALNLRGVPDTLYQSSNGFAAMSGASLGLGFWLGGDPFRGYVLRAVFTNYAYSYESRDDAGEIDAADHTERQLYGMLGSHARWGAFTIAGGIGLGVELNKESRCPDDFLESQCDDSELLISTDRAGGAVDLNGPLHPAVLHARFSLGVAF